MLAKEQVQIHALGGVGVHTTLICKVHVLAY
jgi:hypothetical protein